MMRQQKTFSDYGISIPASMVAGNVSVICPRCSADRKKKIAKPLWVNVEKKVWKCFHCGWTGGLGDGSSYLPERRVYKRPEPLPKSALSKAGLTFLANRGITEEVARRNKIETALIFFPQLNDKTEAIVFPYFRKGELINRKYRAISEKHFRMESDCELILYGLDDIDPEKPVIFVEGEMDKLALESAGYANVVSVPNGAPGEQAKNYESLFSFLDSAHEILIHIKKFIIAVDSDGPGRRLEDELSRRLGVDHCLRTRWPEGRKDANDVLMHDGVEELQWFIENAEPFPVEDVFEITSQFDDVKRFYEKGYERGKATGWKMLDRYYTVRPGEFTAVTGIPSSGKSNFIDALMVNLSKLHDWRFAIFSPENLPVEQHMAAIMEKHTHIPFHPGYRNRMDLDDLKESAEWMSKRFWWIVPGQEDEWTLDKILAAASKLCLRYGIRGLVIDPWNELESLRPERMTEAEYISASLRRVKMFARRHRVHVWVVVHPTKLYRNKDGEYPVPTLYDCAGSANWRNRCDNGLCVWRDLNGKDQAEVQIHVQKIRFRDIGERGMATLFYEKACATYSDVPPLRAVTGKMGVFDDN